MIHPGFGRFLELFWFSCLIGATEAITVGATSEMILGCLTTPPFPSPRLFLI